MAVTYYISPAGNDTTGNGSLGNPWQTISKAFASSVAGDTIHCLAGTYPWVPQNFTSNRNITGAGAATTVFDAGDTAVSWRATSSILPCKDITFQNARSGNTSFGGSDYIFFMVNTVGNFSFTRCIHKNFKVENGSDLFGVYATSGPCAFSFLACLFQNMQCIPPFSQVLFRERQSAAGNVWTVINCTLYSDVIVADAITAIAFSNTGAGGTMTFTNNIFYNANGTPIPFDAGGFTAISGSNNDILGFSSVPGGFTAGISADPLFVDVANGNFNLRPGSPAIDAGVNI